MKKQFLYAAMMVAMMASCSSENDLTDGAQPQAPIENPSEFAEEANYQIKLGVVAPSASAKVAATRGTGMVGGLSASKWNGQKVNVVMYECAINTNKTAYEPTNNFAKELINGTETELMQNVEFVTPLKSADQTTMAGLRARYIVPAQGADPAYEWVKYYPLQGVFAFYGYYLDDITNYTKPVDGQDKVVTGIQIDGANDVMAAQTIPFATTKPTSATEDLSFRYTELDGFDATAEWTTISKRAFSAWTARRGVQPILNFKHLLSQFTFEVIAGQKESVSKVVSGDSQLYDYEGGTATTVNNMNTGVTIADVYVKDISDKFDLKLDAATPSAQITNAAKSGDGNELHLTTLPIGSTELAPGTTLVPLTTAGLTPIIPTMWTGDTDPKYTKVGESLMLLPGQNAVTFYVKVTQNVPYKRAETASPDGSYPVLAYVKKEAILPVTINFTDITGRDAATLGTSDVFMSGESYKIQMAVYGFQEIKIHAVLQDWKDAGSTSVTPEDDWFDENEQ